MSSPENLSTRLQRTAKLAREAPDMAFTSLNHLIDLDCLHEAYRRTRKDGAPGVDGRTAAEYEKDLEANLQSLLNRAKSGSYRAPPVRRAYVPKGKGAEKRPIGIPTFEDKVLQRAVVMVLESIYEQDFCNCSYGFRPGRSAHQALEALWERLMDMKGGWVVEVDIRKFFDTLDRKQLRSIVRQRVRDGVLLRLIGKWLKAGVLEDGMVTYPEAGTPQGGVVSPLLANIYLHEVVDKWFEVTVKLHMGGQAYLFRYADDLVMVFSLEADARRVLEVLPKRFAKYGLTLHPEKTRLVRFEPPRRHTNGKSGGDGKSGAFDLLGFTHYWGRSRRGRWVVKRKTAKDRVSRALRTISQWCRTARHEPLGEQQRSLAAKLRGHYSYYGITGNWRAITVFALEVRRIWKKWLSRRSQHRQRDWDWFNRLWLRYPLPAPVVVHSVLRAQRNHNPRSRMR
jgi:group II intron reverse transcriptase/maturase